MTEAERKVLRLLAEGMAQLLSDADYAVQASLLRVAARNIQREAHDPEPMKLATLKLKEKDKP